MTLKIVNANNETEEVLENVEFKNENNTRYFKVSNNKGIEIKFQYLPSHISNWDSNVCEIYLLENPYLDAENDVFEVYENTIAERIGWIFPITILESNENDYQEYKNLNDYKYVAYEKLLQLEFKISLKENHNTLYRLSDYFSNAIICILHKKTIGKIKDFKFSNYLLSLYKYGYLLLRKTPKAESISDRNDFVNEMRSTNRSRINLTKSKFDITSNSFIKSLFMEHLLQSENSLIRFIFLYQIIEYCMSLEFDIQFESSLEEYKNGKLAKNDLREKITVLSRERELIRIIFEQTKIPSGLKTDYKTAVDCLFREVGRDQISNSFSDNIYNTRNLLTHNLRDLITQTDAIKEITGIFEQIIVEFLINYQK